PPAHSRPLPSFPTRRSSDLVFNIFPLAYSLGYSFTDFRASTNAPANFVGLQNYRDLLNDPYIWNNFAVTAKYVIISVVGQVDEIDRKSTRLNSSHVKISYAV